MLLRTLMPSSYAVTLRLVRASRDYTYAAQNPDFNFKAFYSGVARCDALGVTEIRVFDKNRTTAVLERLKRVASRHFGGVASIFNFLTDSKAMPSPYSKPMSTLTSYSYSYSYRYALVLPTSYS